MPRESRPCDSRESGFAQQGSRAGVQSLARYAIRLAVCMTCALPPVGCVCISPRSNVAVTAGARARVRDRVATEFEAGAFFKPREDATGGVELELAPLIIQQVDAGARTVPTQDRFGLVTCDTNGEVRVDVTRPTVYAASGTIEIEGDEYQRIVYLWFHPPASDSRGLVRCHVLALTIDRDGFPAVLEVTRFDLGPGERPRRDSRLRILFVSGSAEIRARETYGPALGGRHYAIERDIRDAPNTVVARVIEDGPIPMGPFVYLELQTLEVTTLLCRCSSSQVDEIVETRYYELAPIEHLPATMAERLGAWVESERFGQSPGAGGGTGPANLAEVLRWPGLSP